MTTIQQLFEGQVARMPGAIAVNYCNNTLTYTRLNDQANQLANFLLQNGLKRGDFVGVCSTITLELPVNLLAVIKAGGVLVPLDPSHPKDRLEHIFDQAEMKALIGPDNSLQQLPLEGRNLLTFATDKAFESYSTENPLLVGNEDSPAYVVYSSGTTGAPKGITIQNIGMTKWLSVWQDKSGLQMGSGQNTLLWPSICFDAGLWDVFRTLLTGGTLYLLPSLPNTAQLIKFIIAHQIHHITLTTPIVTAFSQLLTDPSYKIPHSLKIVSTGSAFNPAIIEAFLSQGHQLFNGYGPTEVGVGATLSKVQHSTLSRLLGVPVGHPISGMEFLFMDLSNPETFHYSIEDGQGELLIGGAGVTRCYLSREDLNTHNFIEIGSKLYFRTGDIFKYSNGNYYYLGRSKRQAKIYGQLVNPEEVENIIKSLGKFVDVAVTIMEDASGVQQLVAYYELSKASQITLKEIRQHIGSKLPPFAIPSIFIPLEKIPLGVNSKSVDLTALPSPNGVEKILRDMPVVLPHNFLEEKLRFFCAELLNINPCFLGVTDSLADFGFTSSQFVALAAKIMSDPDIKTNITLDSFKDSTIESLSALVRLERSKENGEHFITELKSGRENLPILWGVHDVTGRSEVYFHSALRMTDYSFRGLNAPSPDPVFGFCKTLDEMASYFMAVILSEQTSGPYNLIGYSFGSGLAAKIAQKLEARGKKVNHLFVLDSAAPSIIQSLSSEKYFAYLNETIEKLVIYLKNLYPGFVINYENQNLVVPHDKKACIEYLFGKIDIFSNRKKEKDFEQLQAHIAIIKNNLIASIADGSTEKPLHCPITFFYTPSLSERHSEDPFMGWKLFSSHLSIEYLEGDHSTIMQEPNVFAWVSIMNSKIFAQERPRSSSNDSGFEMQNLEKELDKKVEAKINEVLNIKLPGEVKAKFQEEFNVKLQGEVKEKLQEVLNVQQLTEELYFKMALISSMLQKQDPFPVPPTLKNAHTFSYYKKNTQKQHNQKDDKVVPEAPKLFCR
jgi:acyl-CoA synthetase (AMP-forming)/AMP-acid ligase II/thioesterase domain-containing protein